MNDKDLFEQLARGPLTRNGFNDQLRKRINERIEKPKRLSDRFRVFKWIPVRAALMFLAVVVCGVWLWSGLPWSGFGFHNNAMNAVTEGSQKAPGAQLTMKEPQSAMLIGLRKDSADGLSSTYRTVLVVPDNDKLAVAADGPGLWMPYKQKFWKIDTAARSDRAVQILVASPADSKEQAPLETPVALRRTEKLLYAGNRYVSILQTTHSSSDGKDVNQASVWVKDIEQMTASRRQNDLLSVGEPHYTLSQVVDTDNAAARADQWTITRVPGKWIAKQPSDTTDPDNGDSPAEWAEISVPLTTDVLSHDTLSLDWDHIYAIERTAQDAFTSPKEDLVAVVADHSINIYPYGLPDFNKRVLKLPIDAAESIVMVQWATASYVNVWKEQLEKWIPPTTNDGL